jgi:hypothetical protein
MVPSLRASLRLWHQALTAPTLSSPERCCECNRNRCGNRQRFNDSVVHLDEAFGDGILAPVRTSITVPSATTPSAASGIVSRRCINYIKDAAGTTHDSQPTTLKARRALYQHRA